MKIRVDVPTSDARRERIEGAVLAQVSAMRAAERADAAVPRALRWRWGLAAVAAAAAAVLAFVLLRGGDERAPIDVAAPSRVVTPAGGTSRFTVDDAVIDAGSDTSVEVTREPNGGVTLVLARGSVDCDVAPRAGRAPFRVVAGDVTVEVVGTRFTVARRPAVRVDVARGKVRVTDHGTTSFVAAGESWPPVQTAQAAPAEPEPEPELDPPTETVAPKPQPARKPRASADTTAAQLRLFDHATSVADKDPDTALRELAEYERRFPNAPNAEDAAWERLLILREQHRDEAVRKEAADYLRKYPHGVYAATAKQFIARP